MVIEALLDESEEEREERLELVRLAQQMILIALPRSSEPLGN